MQSEDAVKHEVLSDVHPHKATAFAESPSQMLISDERPVHMVDGAPVSWIFSSAFFLNKR